MKIFIKKILPISFVNKLKKYILLINGKRLYKIDRIRFQNSAFNIVKNRDKENLEAKIIMHYHSLEKGLSSINFREGFGKTAYTELINTMFEYKNKGFDLNSMAFQSGLSVLNEYIIIHKNTKIDTDEIKKLLNNLFVGKLDNTGGVYVLSNESFINNGQKKFKDLANSRYSVRDYSIEAVDIELINEALKISEKTPSVCNRQPWFSYVIRNKETIKSILEIQNGFKCHGNNIDTLILITSNNNFLSSFNERNQGFVDAGMYSMTLIYSLHSLGAATCALNAMFSFSNDRKIRRLLKIPNNQNLIMFIAVGNYLESFKVPKSSRETFSKKVMYL
jgi:nitroreductase